MWFSKFFRKASTILPSDTNSKEIQLKYEHKAEQATQAMLQKRCPNNNFSYCRYDCVHFHEAKIVSFPDPHTGTHIRYIKNPYCGMSRY